MKESLEALERSAFSAIEEATTPKDLEGLRIKFLGRQGTIASILKEIATLPPEERPLVGQKANILKERIKSQIDERLKSLGSPLGAKAHREDTTLPGTCGATGRLHPLTQVIQEVCDVFLSLGFRVVEGPEIETEYYNFDALNIPKSHPSRDTFDTFYLDTTHLLRSQTSTVQIRVMEKEKPPLRIVAPGRVFRPDAVDASHSFMFHQVEGLCVDCDVRFSDLKGTLSLFSKQFFGPKTRTRFRPHFFPFTEPSAEVDISCILCDGKGCRLCKQKGWIEVLGAGMVHPNVFRAVKVDPSRYRGFAFGMGVERLAMLKYGVDDIRLFFENDLRFLRQF
ncbi:MAG: phenylalanine--tRNA ligase subunit alpha [Candidatus Omnitrophica bacterium]|nr:phenylalanine--tRNA ligase subunit alpha [Candidatus Omnitrophota bacterium]